MSGSDGGVWVRIALECPREKAGAIEEALAAAGAIAISLEDGGEELRLEAWPPDRPLWRTLRVAGLFPADVNGLERVAPLLPPSVLENAQVSELPETDWVRMGQQRFRPTRFGDRLWVSPTWADLPPEAASGAVVRLDPGLAFGTGTHPSTRLCLRQLAGMDLGGKLVVDYGCGSGILGIAALALGAARCIAVDIDPQALEAARKNAKGNLVNQDFDIMSPQAAIDAFRGSEIPASDMLVANVLAGPLVALADTFREFVVQGGEVILSGILVDQAGIVVDAYAPWCRLAIAAREDDWLMLAGSRIHQ